MAGTAGPVFPGLRSPAGTGIRPDGRSAPAAGTGPVPAPAGSAVLSPGRPGALSSGLHRGKRPPAAVHASYPGAGGGVLSSRSPGAGKASGGFFGRPFPADLLRRPVSPDVFGKNRKKNSVFWKKSLSILDQMVYNKLSDIRLPQERMFLGGSA